ncbi:asparagine synthase (glutamine-hydrolyzing) [Bacillaceae bacterium S4-13-58]
MCGISGWADFQKDLTSQRDTVEKMAKQLELRGPDEANTWVSPRAAFGHQRLIVVDPTGGGQPMQRVHDGHQYVLCYNGELYNTEDLRRELVQHGWSFQSHSDTEVLLTSYMEWKEDCVHKLNGIFAFAIWDEKAQELFVARDRLGVKPLFYHYENGSLLFASEIKALLAHPKLKPVVNEEGLSEILALGPSRTPGHGVFKDIHELRPGHIGTLNANGWRVNRYWNVESKEHTESLEETADHIRFLLKDSIERQLISDVPIGTFLSGGVDSSAITAIAAEKLKKESGATLPTFSIDFEENEKYFKKSKFQPNSDVEFIIKMTEEHGTNHFSAVMDNEVLADLLKEATELRDLPGMADVDSSLLWFCREIKKEVTVALSGECADEIFGGYPWFYRPEELEREGFPWIRSSEVRYGLLNKEMRDKLDLNSYMLQRYYETVKETPTFDGDSKEEAQRREMFYLNMNWFMTNLLDRKDRMSMGASLEVRVPFSDHRLVEYVWNVPWEMKRYRDQEKGILRKALEGILPHEVLYRKKAPYPKTHHPAYTKAVVKWMDGILEDPNSRLFDIFDRKQIEELVRSEGKSIQTPWYGQLMTGPQLLAHLGQIDHWLRKYKVEIDI